MKWGALPVAELPLFSRHFYGAPGLREVLAELHAASPERVLIAGGTSMANHLIAAALLSPGDRVLIEAPTYEPLARTLEYLGARLETFPRAWPARFQPDPADVERAVDGAKLVALTNLHNPTGVAIEPERLAAIAAATARAGATLLVDEVYLDFLPSPPHPPPGEHVVVTASLTKVYGLSGLRMGWAVGPRALIDRAWQFKDLMSVLDPYPMEALAERVLRARDTFRAPVLEHARQGRELFAAWARAEGFPVVEPEGLDAHRLNDHLAAHHDTRVVPGDFFGLPGFVRVGFGGDRDVLREGLRRLARGVRELTA
jgi:aspartate/methionine/tyrosine aminotransferase